MIMFKKRNFWIWSIAWFACMAGRASELQPILDEGWWRIASNPDLGEWTSEKQEPVDFAIWKAADGTWQLWSCIRNTKHPGKTRVFHRWEGKKLTDSDWNPRGITFTGDGTIGETIGGMQAPYVIKAGGTYHMYYGDYRHICLALSEDGKRFDKKLLAHGMSGLFGEGPTAMARDPMLIQVGSEWHCYYSAHPDGKHGIWHRTTKDLIHFSESKRVMTGGQSGKNWWNFECPHVVHVEGSFYLFHTQSYAKGKQQSSVYRSADPGYFGVDDDARFIGHLKVAAPEIIFHEGHYYMAALSPELDGIRITRLRWVP